jgi:hypothetical protein
LNTTVTVELSDSRCTGPVWPLPLVLLPVSELLELTRDELPLAPFAKAVKAREEKQTTPVRKTTMYLTAFLLISAFLSKFEIMT